MPKPLFIAIAASALICTGCSHVQKAAHAVHTGSVVPSVITPVNPVVAASVATDVSYCDILGQPCSKESDSCHERGVMVNNASWPPQVILPTANEAYNDRMQKWAEYQAELKHYIVCLNADLLSPNGDPVPVRPPLPVFCADDDPNTIRITIPRDLSLSLYMQRRYDRSAKQEGKRDVDEFGEMVIRNFVDIRERNGFSEMDAKECRVIVSDPATGYTCTVTAS